MNEYNEGDLVEAVRGDTIVRSRVRLANDGLTYLLGDNVTGIDLFSYLHNGFTVTVIEKATPPLPTEPGYYFDNQGDAWRLGSGWVCLDSGGDLDPKTFAPFTRLEPVADTAKKVLAAIESEYGEDYYRNKDDSWNTVAKQFGVSK